MMVFAACCSSLFAPASKRSNANTVLVVMSVEGRGSEGTEMYLRFELREF